MTCDERRDLIRVIRMRVERDVDLMGSGLPGEPLHRGEDLRLQEVLRQRNEGLRGQSDVTDVRNLEDRRDETLQ